MLLISQDQEEQLSEASLYKFQKRAAEHLKTIFPEKFDPESKEFKAVQKSAESQFEYLEDEDIEQANKAKQAQLPLAELIEVGRKKAKRLKIFRERQIMLFIDLLVTQGIDFPEPEAFDWAKTIFKDPELSEKAKIDLVFENLRVREEGAEQFSLAAKSSPLVEENTYA